MLGYLVDDKVLVLLNAGDTEKTFKDVVLPEGDWMLIATQDGVDIKGVKSKNKTAKVKAGSNDITVEATGLYIWVKK